MTQSIFWWLMSAQLAMGAFDTLYHHELIERLAWRPSQRSELQLHGARNLMYAALFLTIAWVEPHGLLAAALIALLAIEVVVTLADFVEEDRSRALPPSERVTHTLLAINYGAILMLMVPLLWRWACDATDAMRVDHGLWSWLLTAAAFGVVASGTRDFFAAARSDRLVLPPAAPLVAAMVGRHGVLVTGATGFIGRRLVAALVGAGHDVTALVRDPARARLPAPIRLVTDLRQLADDAPLDAVVNLAGEPIAAGPWTAARGRRILASRLRTTRAIDRLLGRLTAVPDVLVSGSAIGFYGVRGDEALDESDPGRDSFSHRLCAAWEAAARRVGRRGPRIVCLRIGLVLGSESGVLGRLLPLFDLGLGGPVGSGAQWQSWIERDDLVRLIAHAIATPSLRGPVNAVAPAPVRQREFARAIGKALGRPAFLPLPAFPLRAALGTMADELLLGGQRVLPVAALASGFRFDCPTLPMAARAILGCRASPREAVVRAIHTRAVAPKHP